MVKRLQKYISASKGQQFLQKAMILLVITLLVVMFAMGPLQGSIDENVRQNVVIKGHEIASAINLLKSAPSQTSYETEFSFRSAVTDCKITFRRNGIDLRYKNNGNDDGFFLGVIEGGPELQDEEIDCTGKITIAKISTATTDEVVVSGS